MIAIYKRELRSYFNSMIGYVFIAVVVAFIGIYFMATNLVSGYSNFSYAISNVTIIILFMIPILTMKSMAEEQHSKTDQMLLTYPVTVTKMVLGKFLAMATVFAFPVLLTCFCPLIIAANGTAHLGTDYATILAFFCLGCLFISIGMFASALTESQIIAAVGTFGVLLLLYLWPNLVNFLPKTASGNMFGLMLILTGAVLLLYSMSKNKLLSIVIEAAGVAAVLGCYLFAGDRLESLLPNMLGTLSCTDILNNFALYNVFDLGGLFFYLSCAALFVFLTVQVVQKRRWN
jgi:ABC-2 type transport system permease protein